MGKGNGKGSPPPKGNVEKWIKAVAKNDSK
jgi:hypothetical protein